MGSVLFERLKSKSLKHRYKQFLNSSSFPTQKQFKYKQAITCKMAIYFGKQVPVTFCK